MKRTRLSIKHRLEHILQAIEKIEHYCEHTGKETFREDALLHDAVLYQFMIIGEAIANVDNQTLEGYEYPWHLPRSFRNYIAHEYSGINLEIIWNTIQSDLPGLKKIIQTIIGDFHD